MKKKYLLNFSQRKSSLWRAFFLLSFSIGACGFFTSVPPTAEGLAQGNFRRVEGPTPTGAVLDIGPSGTWYDHSVLHPTVVYDGGRFLMWFTGTHLLEEESGYPYDMIHQVGFAKSADGLHWEVQNGGSPVLEPGEPGRFDDGGVSHPFVLKLNGRYYMWYGGIRKHMDSSVQTENVGLATSDDGLHWTRENGGNPVLLRGSNDDFDQMQATGMHVIEKDGHFEMWYGGYYFIHRIGMATSPDGVRWTKAHKGKPVTGLEGQEQLGPSVFWDGEKYLMFYSNKHDWEIKWKEWNENGVQKTTQYGLWRILRAVSDNGVNWTPLKKNDPVLPKATMRNFGSARGVHGNNQSVHPSKIIIQKDRALIYYQAEQEKPLENGDLPHQRIGLMSARLQPQR